MSTHAESARPVGGLGATSRTDPWWTAPVCTAVALGTLVVYATVAVALGSHYVYTAGGAHYLSPFYSPDLKSMAGLSLPFSYAFLVVWPPLGLRASCYYYRKAYYRAFFLAPPACAVSGPRRRRYRGEAALPFILQNAHRYFLYLATIVLGFLWYDAVRGFFFRGAGGALHVGVGVGSLVLLGNVVFLSLFTFGCNSARHLAGRTDCFACSLAGRTRHKLWRGISLLNRMHMEWAWVSLFWVCSTDLYIRLAAAGVFHDPRIF